jgi:hypothetical protein
MSNKPSQPKKNEQSVQAGQYDDPQQQQQQQRSAGGVQQFTFAAAPPRLIDTATPLRRKPRVTVAFPPCSEELLALINTADATNDEVTRHFQEYFRFTQHQTLGQFVDKSIQPEQLRDLDRVSNSGLDNGLLQCLGTTFSSGGDDVGGGSLAWPTECCLCPPCVALDGSRNPNNPPGSPGTGIRRLFVGDLVWLFYFERMGIFQILGAILDSYACNGRFPISNGSLEPIVIKDNIIALVLEVMVRQTKMGMSSATRDRACAYRTSLGWTSSAGQKLALNTEVNTGFSTLFHRLIFNGLEFFRDKRLAVAIQSTAGLTGRPSVATLITIRDTIDVLRKRFEAFSYGRNYYNTLSGIVWTIAGMSVIRDLRTTLGIPPAFGDPHEYIPAAYELLVMKRPVTHGDSNRYILHRECARNARDILLDLEVINHEDTAADGELENWLTQVESKFEGYRTAYRTLTGVDLGSSGTPSIEQQV